MPETKVETKVKAVLETYGLLDKVSDEELTVFVNMYPVIRAAADSIWIAETQYEEMALFFNPGPGD
ncbi:MAG: hypothetical protein JWM76_5248 [Pseudonocardiales bacterium]|nr:hypothetical protein [Pseudonocardiales bacterium]